MNKSKVMKTYKTFSFLKDENPKICNLIFKVYLLIANKSWNKNEYYHDYVYDDYDIIDTLGSQRDEGRFTEYYSSELVCEFSIKFLGLKFTGQE